MKSMRDEANNVSNTVINSARSDAVLDTSALGAMVPASASDRELIDKDKEMEEELEAEKKKLQCGIENCGR